ncbi:MAG: NAD-dependent malic enzyme [Burkholderiaceae bacterium]
MKFSQPAKDDHGQLYLNVELRGHDLLHEPLLNKGSAFTADERKTFGLEGFMPTASVSMAVQVRRVLDQLNASENPFQKYITLSNLQDRNEHLYYRVLLDHLEEMMPIVYTPTVGEATQKFSRIFRRGRGIWITPEHRGNMKQMLGAISKRRKIALMVVTDGESILGIGDQGAGGMGISIGKLALYCAGAGIHPATTLPVCLDVGTNNQALLEDEFYLGWPHARLVGSEYDELVAEFVEAVKETMPGALVQWEDFRKDNALKIMETYRNVVPSFNDDIQGTGAVALAGVLSALRITGQSLADQRIVIHGAGAAGLGIARQLRAALRESGLSEAAVLRACCVLDSRGLLIEGRDIRDAYKKELAWTAETAQEFDLVVDGDLDLATVVSRYRPTVMIGSSGQAGAFTEAIVRDMATHTARPIILPFSNPSVLTEARPASLYQWTDGRCLVATGSPFPDVTVGGRTFRIGQGNNVFVFPGLGMAAVISGIARITDPMISAAAAALAGQVTQDELDQGLLYPTVSRLRQVSATIAQAVIRQAIAEDACPPMDDEAIAAKLAEAVWEPAYVEYRPV